MRVSRGQFRCADTSHPLLMLIRRSQPLSLKNLRAVATGLWPVPLFGSNKFSRIQDVVWIENLFQVVVHVTYNLTRRVGPPAFFCKTNSVLASNYAAPGQHLR